jgi:DNA-binding transcriptional ArsR family regulator
MGTPRDAGHDWDSIEAMAALSKLLGCPTRLDVLFAVADRPGCVGEIADRLSLGGTVVSHHLRSLRDAGVLHAHAHGRRRSFVLRDGVETVEVGGRRGVSLPAGLGRLVYLLPARSDAGVRPVVRATETPPPGAVGAPRPA